MGNGKDTHQKLEARFILSRSGGRDVDMTGHRHHDKVLTPRQCVLSHRQSESIFQFT